MNGKMPYEKPGLELVDFSLSSSVAGACKYEVPSADVNSCGALTNGWLLYADSTNGVCNIGAPVNDEDPFFCYQVPVEDRTVHNS